jgi:GIY-YIG catalytic domain
VIDRLAAAHQVIQALTSERPWSRHEVLAGPCKVPAKPGIYGWYLRDLPAALPLDRCVHRDGLSLLYVGIAPKKASSASTLRKRIVDNHFNARRGLSTLRLTLALLLGFETRHTPGRAHPAKPSAAFDVDEQPRICGLHDSQGTWMLEKLMISRLQPPLNLAGNRANPFYPCLKALRQAA